MLPNKGIAAQETQRACPTIGLRSVPLPFTLHKASISIVCWQLMNGPLQQASEENPDAWLPFDAWLPLISAAIP
jgi:hypothetical protein